MLQPPDSVRQAMSGYGSWPPPASNGDARLDPVAVPILPGYTYLGGGHQSVWLLNAMLQRTAGGPRWDARLGDVASDHLSVFREDATGTVVAVWRVALATAVPFTAAMAGRWTSDPRYFAVHLGDTDTALVATAGADAEAVFGAIEGWESPEAAIARLGAEEQGRRRTKARRAPLQLE